jgi:hypothetical protein
MVHPEAKSGFPTDKFPVKRSPRLRPPQFATPFIPTKCRLLARTGPPAMSDLSPLSGAKRTLRRRSEPPDRDRVTDVEGQQIILTRHGRGCRRGRSAGLRCISLRRTRLLVKTQILPLLPEASMSRPADNNAQIHTLGFWRLRQAISRCR